MRSRLEARWASFFDLCDWPWTYEPFDLNGYAPDFLLHFSEPIIVEVKPEMLRSALALHIPKLSASGWDKEAVIVGAYPFEDGNHYGSEGVNDKAGALGIMREHVGEDNWEWSGAVFEICLECKQYSFFHSDGCWSCRRSGCYEGDHFLEPIGFHRCVAMWNEASSAVQWIPKGAR